MQAMSGLIVDLGREDSALLASAPVGQLYSPGGAPSRYPSGQFRR